MNDLKAKLLQVLTAVNFDGSPNKVVVDLVTTSIGKGLDELSAKLSEDEVKIIHTEQNPEVILALLEKYYSKDEIKDKMDESLKGMINIYIDHIVSTLSDDKKSEVMKIVESSDSEKVIVM